MFLNLRVTWSVHLEETEETTTGEEATEETTTAGAVTVVTTTSGDQEEIIKDFAKRAAAYSFCRPLPANYRAAITFTAPNTKYPAKYELGKKNHRKY